MAQFDNAQSDLLADESGSSSGSNPNCTGVPMLAQGTVSSYSVENAREGKGGPSNQSQETMLLAGRFPAWEQAVSAVFSELSRQDDQSERLVLADHEGVLDQRPRFQAEWQSVDLAGLLLVWWLPYAECLLEEQSARPRRWLQTGSPAGRGRPLAEGRGGN